MCAYIYIYIYMCVCVSVCIHLSQCEALAKGRPCHGLMKNGGKPLVGGIKRVGDPSIL